MRPAENHDKNLIELTDFEKVLLHVNRCGDSLVMVTAFVESTNLNNQLNEELCRKALSFLQKRHPFLRAFLTENTNLEIQTDNYDSLELEWSDNSITYHELISQLETFNCKLFDFKSKSHLARSKIASFIHLNGVKTFALNLSGSIVITDGVNITTLIIEFINIINALAMNKECNEILQILEPAESLNYMADKQQMVGWKQKLIIKLALKFLTTSCILPNEFRPENESGFKLNFSKVDKHSTSEILKKAKENNIKITGYLIAVVYYALKKLYDENNVKFPKVYPCALPVNLRMRYEPNMSFSDMRNHAGLAEVDIQENKLSGFTNIWKDSKYIHRRVQEAASLDYGALFTLTHHKSFMRKFLKKLDKSSNVENSCELINNQGHCDLKISNIGGRDYKIL